MDQLRMAGLILRAERSGQIETGLNPQIVVTGGLGKPRSQGGHERRAEALQSHG